MKLNSIVIFSLLLLINNIGYSQDDFETKITALTNNLATKISEKNKKTIAVWDFTDNQGNITNLGKYIAELVSVKITNNEKGFSVMDRNHLATILREHKLNAEGYIDQKTAKEIGEWVAVDAIITGNITVFEKKIKLTMKVLETQTAMIISAIDGDLPIDDDIRSFLNNSGTSSTGYNRQITSNEQVNNPETVSKDCEINNTGDYCFTNNTNFSLLIEAFGPVEKNGLYGHEKITIEKGQTECLYNLQSSNWKIKFSAILNYQPTNDSYFHGSKQIMVEKCKSLSYTFK